MSWNKESLEKARAYELVKLLSQHLSARYPWLMNCTVSQVLGRLAPIRRTPDNRMIRFFGIDCAFPHDDEARVAGFLLDQFLNGVGPVNQTTIVLACDLPYRRQISDVLKRNKAYSDGLIASNGEGLYGWQVPPDEREKPELVIIPAA